LEHLGMGDAEMDFTGERVIPGITPDRIWRDHMSRYEHAAQRVQGKRVLDVACGTGYGADLYLRAKATSVEGLDIDGEAIRHATKTYGRNGLRFQEGSIEALPFADHSFDLVTCFETIEHVDRPEVALAELRRVLRPQGELLVSTPNRRVTSPMRGLQDAPVNLHHKREWTVGEFKRLVAPLFKVEQTLGQRSRPRLLFLRSAYPTLKRRAPSWYVPALGDPTPRRVLPWQEPRYMLLSCRRP
jgi:SAM-dependent methyltransferase